MRYEVSRDQELSAIRRTLAERSRREIPLDDYLPAAVALPLVPSASGTSVLLTVRTSDVEHHKGEISFPGGRVDPADPDTLSAALRETWEEVGIRPEDLKVLGSLDDFVSITGYRVTPYVVCLPRSDYPYVPQPKEVAEILLVPLEHLLDRRNHYLRDGPEAGPIHHFQWRSYVIWGLTAAVLNHFLDLAFDFKLR
jgi:8-oxo-dGTP pyrophosphatase MutT (NUDIX family)